MIKFFRRIRQRLISENRFSKYLLYAIGEIILLVIGILIAISLNNKNQYDSRKLDRDIKITKIRNVIYKDSIAFSNSIENSFSMIKKIDQMISTLNPNMTFEEYQILVAGFQEISMNFRTVEPNTTVYDELINSGSFSQIEDEALKEKISSLYGLYAHFGTLIVTFRNNFTNTKSNLFNSGIIGYKYFLVKQSEETLRDGYEAFQFVLRDRKQLIIFENYLYKEREFHEQISGLYQYLIYRQMAGLPLKDKKLDT
ncbi:DUF6090 family protein [Winogradskyella sp.]|uniref:DUF6090 family protein n=1 Tax=Winogradskyella sp. TaxID=1883156 RepID=UPI003518EE56